MNKKLILLILLVCCIAFLFYVNSIYPTFDRSFKKILSPDETSKTTPHDAYRKNCIELYTELRNPKPDSIHRPPLKEPPAHLMDEFTQNGDMPITKYWYFDMVYSDSNAKNTGVREIISKESVEKYRLSYGKNRAGFTYDDSFLLEQIMHKYSHFISRKTIAVIGTENPWVEAIALDTNSSKVYTFDYTRKEYEQKDILQWTHVFDYLDSSIKRKAIEEFDNIASFSSIEHTGLGRYGDPLDPNGDIKAIKQIHCMLKPGGILFLGLPASKDNSSFIEFNAHRIYGHKRLAKLFVGWDLIEETPRTHLQSVFVLRKN
jgi:hypothetical protein